MARATTREVLDVYPLTPAQQGILAETIASPGVPVYLQHHVLEITGTDDPQVLRGALAGLTGRHDVLRTAFVWDVADQPLQVVRGSAEVALTIEDLGGTGAEVIARRTAQLLGEERATPFDLRRPPLLRARALRTGEASWRLIVTHHHLILDGWSVSLLHAELAELLAARAGGRAAVLPAPRPFREFVTWQRETRDAAADLAYLRDLLGGVSSATPLGDEGPGIDAEAADPVTVFRPVTGEAHPARAARRAGVRPATLVHAAWALLLARWSGRQDVVFGTTVSGRPGELDDAGQRIGMFLNTSVLRIPVPEGGRAGEWLHEVQGCLDRSRPHEHVPLSLASQCSGAPPGTPLLTSVLAFQNYWRPGHGDVTAALGGPAAGSDGGAAGHAGPGAAAGAGPGMAGGAGAGTTVGGGPEAAGGVGGSSEVVRLRVVSRSERPGLPLTVAVALPDEGVWVRVGYDPAQVSQAAARLAAETFCGLVARLASLALSTVLADVPALTAPVPAPRDEPPAGALMTAIAAGLREDPTAVVAAADMLTGAGLRVAVGQTAARLRACLVPAASAGAGESVGLLRDRLVPAASAGAGESVGLLRDRLAPAPSSGSRESARPVAICAPPGPALVTGLLAVLASGGVPVLADPCLPAPELSQRLAGAPVLVLAGTALAREPGGPVVEIAGAGRYPAATGPATGGAGTEQGVGGDAAGAGRHPVATGLAADGAGTEWGFSDGAADAGLAGLAFGVALVRDRLRLTAEDVVLVVLAADDPVLPSVVLAALAAGCRLELCDPAGADSPPAGPTVLVAAAPTAAGLLEHTASGARVVLAGDPPAPGEVRRILQSGRSAWRVWASGRTGGADACAELRDPADALLLGEVPGGMAADGEGRPLPPGRIGELVIVRAAGPCRAAVAVRSTGTGTGTATFEQLGRGVADELAFAGHRLGLADGIAAAVVTAGPRDRPHAWLVAAGGADALTAARAAERTLPARLRPAGYTVLAGLPVARHGGIDTFALGAALLPVARPAPAGRDDPVADRLARLAPGVREAFAARLRALAARVPAPQATTPEERAAYWRSMLGRAEPARWPVPSAGADRSAGPVVRELTVAREAREAAWIAATATALAFLAGTDEVLVGVVTQPGPSAETATAAGADARTLPLPVSVSAGQPFGVTVAAVDAALRRARAHGDVPWAALERLLPGPLALSVAVHEQPGALAAHGGAAIAIDIAPGPPESSRPESSRPESGRPESGRPESGQPESGQSESGQSESGRPGVAGDRQRDTVLTAACAPGRAHPVDARRLLELTAAVIGADAARPLRPADLTSAEALAEVLRRGDGGPATQDSTVTVGELVLARSQAAPHATALEAPDETLSYRELARRALALAGRLRGMGAGLEDRVAVCLPRQAAMAWAPLGIMIAGAAYVPLDPDHPDERLRMVLDGTRARAVVTTASLAGRFPDGPPVLLVEGEAQDAPDEPPAGARPDSARPDSARPDSARPDSARPDSARPDSARPDSAAYVLYTSGSTGQPKGVVVEHRAVTSFCAEIARAYHIGPGSRLLAFAAPTFDVSVFELWAGLAAGATVVLAGSDARQSPEALQRLLAGRRVTAAELPPSLMPLLDPDGLPDLSLVSVGGEAPAGALVDGWATPQREFWNGYGPTETTVAVTLMRCLPPSGGRVPPIGLPVPGHRGYLLDESLRPVPPGVPGELCIAGRQLARGYLGLPGETAARFVPDPYGPPGARMYRTGDLARWTGDGVLEFLGRADRQIKIRGFRVEPGEVEAALAGHPAVRQVTVQPWDAPDGTRHLAAYVVPAAGTDPPALAGLRAAAAARLPAHMLPTRLARLAGLPLTPAGKVDVKALPEPGADAAASDTTGWSETEHVLAAEVIGPLIGVPQPGRDDQFFELGGNSIQAAQVTARVRDRFGAEISLMDFFREPTVAGLAKLVDRAAMPAPRPDAEPAPARYQMTGGATLPLSFPQATLYAACRADGDIPGYHAPLALRLRGRLDLDALRAAFGWLIGRHAPLRVTFADGPQEPVQFVHPLAEPSWTVSDVPDEAPEARERLLRQAVGAEAARPFDLARGPLLRVRVHRLGDTDHAVQWTIHHVATDGWSTSVQLHELGVAYHAFAAGREPALPPLATDYGEFVGWHRDYVAGPDYRDDLAWWQRTLAGLPADLRLARPGPAFRHGWRNLLLPEDTAVAVKDFARAQGVTLFMTCLAVQAIIMSAETGCDDVLTFTPYALRVHSAWEDLVGWFANPVPVRVRVPAGLSFAGLAGQARQASTAAFAHAHVPFELLRAELALGNPAIAAQISVMNAPARQFGFSGFDSIAVAQDDSGRYFTPVMEVYSPPGTRFQFSIVLRERMGGIIAGGLEYDAAAVDEPTADRWTSAFLSILAAGARAPDTAVAELARLAGDPSGQARVSR